MKGDDVVKATASTLLSLSWLNFAVANMQAGFGPFVAVRLTANGWEPRGIGLVLSASTIAAVLAQLPSGAIIDHLGSKRGLAAAAIIAAVLALLLLGHTPSFGSVLLAEIVQGAAGVGLTLSIAAITLSVARKEMLGERFGRNVRYAAIGSAVGTALLGVVGTKFSDRAVFDVAAAFGVVALIALHRIRADDLATAATRTDHHSAMPRAVRRSAAQSPRGLLRHHRLVALLAAVALFQLGNASMLPLAAGRFAGLSGSGADLVVAGAVLVPQLLAALLSPWLGAWAQLHGRRRIFMLGLTALPLRAFVFAASSSVPVMLAAQWLDGICAATMGVMIPLIVADLTHRGGRFNLVLAMTGLSSSIGATLSTAAGGAIAQYAGLPTAFLGLTVAGLCAVLVVWAWLPETAHLPHTATGHPP